MSGVNKKVCSQCCQTINARKESLSRGIVRSLYKVAQVANVTDLNKVHPRRDANLTISEYNNFQKLRYHGLVAKYKQNGENISGYWLITKRGYKFLNNEIRIPKYVHIVKNRIMGYGDKKISMLDVVESVTPYFPEISTIEYL